VQNRPDKNKRPALWGKEASLSGGKWDVDSFYCLINKAMAVPMLRKKIRNKINHRYISMIIKAGETRRSHPFGTISTIIYTIS
jgi:hypothetical protein